MSPGPGPERGAGEVVPAFAFAHAALDRRSEWRDDVEKLDASWRDEASRVLLVRRDGRVLCLPERGTVVLVPPAAVPVEPSRASLLGERDGVAHFAATLGDVDADALATAHGGKFLDLRTAAGVLAAPEAGLAAYARALAHWQSRKHFCGRCGAPTQFGSAGHRAVCTDPACGQEYFPRTDPCVIALVSDGTRCLLGNQAAWGPTRFSTLAGFVEPGETLEHAVAREVAEEAGVRVGRCRYVGAQPWPFPASLMLGFEAEATSYEITVGDELADARWFDAGDMPGLIARGELVISPAISIAYHLIAQWYARVAGGTLPPGPLVHPRR